MPREPGGELGAELDAELDAELHGDELARWESEAAVVVREYLAGQWAMRSRGLAPPPPRALVAPQRRQRLQTWRSQRALALWRWYAFAEVEGDPAVATAFSRWRDGPGPARLAALFAARSARARHMGFADYGALARARDELDEASVRAAAARLSRAPEPRTPAFAATAQDVRARLEALGFVLDGVGVDCGVGERARARCFPVAPPRDVRVYVRAPAGARLVRALAHELGHAAVARAAPATASRLQRGASSRTVDEAVATWAENAVSPVPWRARGRALAARVAFETEAYRAPTTNLELLWERVQGGGRSPWSAGSYAALDPGSQAAYLVGTALALALPAPDPQLAARVTDLAARRPWKDGFAEAGAAL